eukprot:gene11609-7998_t
MEELRWDPAADEELQPPYQHPSPMSTTSSTLEGEADGCGPPHCRTEYEAEPPHRQGRPPQSVGGSGPPRDSRRASFDMPTPYDNLCDLDGEAVLARCVHPDLEALVHRQLASFSTELSGAVYQRLVRVGELFRDERHREVVDMCEELLMELLQRQRSKEEVLRGGESLSPAEAPQDAAASAAAAMRRLQGMASPPSPAQLYGVIQDSSLLTEARSFLRRCDALVQDMEMVEGWKCLKSHRQELVLAPLARSSPDALNMSGEPSSASCRMRRRVSMDLPTSRRERFECGLWYHHDPSTHLHLFKATHVMELQVVYGFGVLLEVDLFTLWFPNCHTAADLADVSKFQKVAHFVLQSPWPFANRDVLFIAHATDDLQRNRRVVIEAHSLTAAEAHQISSDIPTPEPPEDSGKKCVRAIFQRGGFAIELLDPTHAKISILVAIDPKLPHSVPQWAINWASQTVIWKMLMDLSKRSTEAKEQGSVYAQRRRDKFKMYKLLRERFNEIILLHFDVGSELLVQDNF